MSLRGREWGFWENVPGIEELRLVDWIGWLDRYFLLSCQFGEASNNRSLSYPEPSLGSSSWELPRRQCCHRCAFLRCRSSRQKQRHRFCYMMKINENVIKHYNLQVEFCNTIDRLKTFNTSRILVFTGGGGGGGGGKEPRGAWEPHHQCYHRCAYLRCRSSWQKQRHWLCKEMNGYCSNMNSIQHLQNSWPICLKPY